MSFFKLLYSNWGFFSKSCFYLLAVLPINSNLSLLDQQMTLMEMPFYHCGNYKFGCVNGFYKHISTCYPERKMEHMVQFLPAMKRMKIIEESKSKRPLQNFETESYNKTMDWVSEHLTNDEIDYLNTFF